MVSAATTVAALARLPRARLKLMQSYVALVKAMQSMGHRAAMEGPQGVERERELMDWVQARRKGRWPLTSRSSPGISIEKGVSCDDTVQDMCGTALWSAPLMVIGGLGPRNGVTHGHVHAKEVLVDILGPPRPLKSDDQLLAEELAKLEQAWIEPKEHET